MIKNLLRGVLVVLAVIIVVPVAAVVAVWVGLNTGAGRGFAVREINHFAGAQIQVAGLRGHFPANLILQHATLTDAKGVYATIDHVDLQWRPAEIFARHLHVTSLTITDVSVLRAPLAQAVQTSSSGGGGLPKLSLDIDHFAIGALHMGTALAGQDVTLALAGDAHLQNFDEARLDLHAIEAAGKGTYDVQAAMDAARIDARIIVAEPPHGLIGHFAGARVNAPLNLDLTVQGPRESADVKFAAALGAALVNGAGTVALDTAAPKADLVLNVPSLAPVAALAGQNVAGHTSLHVIARHAGDRTDLSLDGDVSLTSGPGPAAALVGKYGTISSVLSLADGTIDIKKFAAAGAGFDVAAQGHIAPAEFSLTTHAALKDVGLLSPGISGPVAEAGSVQGRTDDFAVDAVLTGNISDKKIPSGPFSITLSATHLPGLPQGRLTGSGALEGAPLILDAQFARNAAGAVHVLVNKLLWRSLQAQADMSLAQGEALPTGTAKFSVDNLADFARFSPTKLSGRIDGNFAHAGAQNILLNLNARHVLAAPAMGAVDATLNASGPVNALAVKFAGMIAQIVKAPARASLAGVFNLDARNADLSAFSATWKTVNLKLQGLASIETKPGIAVHHLALALNGGRITLDGGLTPRLNFALTAKDIPLSLATLAAPTLQASGVIGASAMLTGTLAAPAGKINIIARNARLHQGPAAALPAADLTTDILLSGQTANVNARLGLGDNAILAADGLVPLSQAGPISLHLTGRTDLRLLDPILAVQGSTLRGVITPDITITGTAASPRANGTITLANGSVQNIGSGVNLTAISARLLASGRLVTLEDLQAQAGSGSISGHGTVDLGAPSMPVDFTINAANATPVSSDLVTESLNAALTVKGLLQGNMALAGNIDLLRANINIPKSLPPSVANLQIVNDIPPPAPPAPPPPDIALDVTVRAKNQVFIRGDGLFAELGGTLHLTGTAADPNPQGGFTLIRGNYALAGKTLQFTKGTVNFTGDGFMPTLDLEASTTTASNTTATLLIGGTAAKPTITLSASPPLPSDEVLSQLLFGQATSSLSPFQAASLAAALASLSGIGGSAVSDPLGGVRNALGLDELSLGGSGAGAPTVNAGRYVAPGVYVGARQSTSGQGTQATVQINLYKGLQLQTATGTSGTGGAASSSVGLTYQFNY